LTLAGSAFSNLHSPAGASIIDLSPLDGDFAAAAVAQLDLAEMTDDAVILRPAPWAKPVRMLLDYMPHWQPHHLSPPGASIRRSAHLLLRRRLCL
jgi:hypothetical protein